jgi:hypothetical protein
MLRIALPVLSGLLCVGCASTPHGYAGELQHYALDDGAQSQRVLWQSRVATQPSAGVVTVSITRLVD